MRKTSDALMRDMVFEVLFGVDGMRGVVWKYKGVGYYCEWFKVEVFEDFESDEPCFTSREFYNCGVAKCCLYEYVCRRAFGSVSTNSFGVI